MFDILGSAVPQALGSPRFRDGADDGRAESGGDAELHPARIGCRGIVEYAPVEATVRAGVMSTGS